MSCATIAWSYGLLDEQERLLWARLSVFAGGFEGDAAVEVCCDPRIPAGRIACLLGALVDKSILKGQLKGPAPPRYWLLETMRQYGRQRLREAGEQTIALQRHFGWVRVLAESIGAWDARQVALFDRMYREQHKQTVSIATRGLGQRAFDAAFARGRAMTIGEGVSFAEAGSARPEPPACVARTEPPAVLTGRQLEIARLVADDVTNRQIADRLFLSERTAETHVTNILNKLGLGSRVQISRWVAESAPAVPSYERQA